MKTVQEVIALTGVTRKALRYYDEIGLLKPTVRSDAGYRLYGRAELLRLREILVWRQLGFPLADVATLVDDPDHDGVGVLRRQMQLVSEQHGRFKAMLRGLEAAMAAVDDGRSLMEDDIFHGFDVSLTSRLTILWTGA